MTLALIAALPSEIKPIIRGWQKRGSGSQMVWTGRVGGAEAIALCPGMGEAAATRACEAALAHGGIDAVASVGYAGSLSCGLQVGSAYAVREVIDAATGERFATDTSQGQKLITLNAVAGPEEKRKLASQHEAVMVDMEASAVARFARDHNLRFYAFKAITDGPNDKLPDFNRFISSDGQLRTAALAAWAAVHPGSWNALGRLGRNSRRATDHLAALISRCLEPSP